MDTSREYIKMCDCPEIQGQIKDVDRCSFWAKRLITGKYSMWCSYHAPGDIWLPRQDQIQEMIFDDLARADVIVHDLNKWREKNYDYQLQFITMEQFLLAVYMHEKHSKIWSSKKGKWLKKQ